MYFFNYVKTTLLIFITNLNSVYLQLINFNEMIKFSVRTTLGRCNFLIIKYGSLVDLTVFPSIIFRAVKEKERKKKTRWRTQVMECSQPSKSNVYICCVMWGDRCHLLPSLILCGCLCAHTPAFIFIMYWQNVIPKTLKATTSTERHSQHTKLLSTLRNCGRLELLNGSIK